MSTHKHFDKICCVVLIFTLLITILFVNAENFGIKKASSVPGYEIRLFDTSSVHTIDIVMDNWDEFLANCKNEEYYSCAVVIDNEAYKNVAIRAKGNTSLTQVEAYGNNRYSFKIEFDHYDSSKTYYGLDKLCLNNIIQDNTYMKDYLTYQMMAQMDVASPLCSYVNITVNGEEWGLYLAVEGVEEAFLQRNYGNDYGELYKPDSTGMGGGRGNGEKFDMNEIWSDSDSESTDNTKTNQSTPQMPNDVPQNNSNGDSSKHNGIQGGTPPELSDDESPFHPGTGEMQNDMIPPIAHNRTDHDDTAADGNAHQSGDKSNGMPGGGMSSDDVLLKYIDDEPDSYSNIFDNAKTDISSKDKTRLIEALQKLSSGEELDGTVEVEAVIRYFVVHNFVLNFDSYTGSMIHNYYLYEKDGQMQMIPWDYNLAFGSFESAGDATNLVNYPIDSPVSGGNVEDRPIIAWIFANEEYTELYHRYFSEFISEWFENGNLENMIDSVSAMISPYVEKDPTKFCAYEEFITGVSTLKEFCSLRAESIEGQLSGRIGSTSDTQKSSELIDAGDLQISDMGSMQNSIGRGMSNQPKATDNNGSQPTLSSDEDSSNASSSEQTPPNYSDSIENDAANGTFPQMPDGQMPEENTSGRPNDGIRGEFPTDINGKTPNANGIPDEIVQKNSPEQTTASISTFLWLAASIIILALAILFAHRYRRRK